MFTKIDQLIWSDTKYRALSSDAKLMFIYFLSCPHRNMLGMYFLPVQYGACDLNWEVKRFSKGLGELLEKGLINYDFDTNIVFIKNFLKYNAIENPNQVIGAEKALDLLPKDTTNVEIVMYLKSLNKPFLKPLIERLDKGLPKQEEEEEEVKAEEYVEVKGDEEVEKTYSPAKDRTSCPYPNIYALVIDYLNVKADTKYRATTKKTQTLIRTRQKEGFELEDFKKVIDTKVKEWRHDPNMVKYLRPETLFGTKFEGYLNQKEELDRMQKIHNDFEEIRNESNVDIF